MIDKSPPVRVGMSTPERKEPREVVTVRIKNRGSNPRILSDTSLRPVKLLPGEAKAIEISKKFAERIRQDSLKGGGLIVLDASELGGKIERVRIESRDHRFSQKVAPTKDKFGRTTKSSGKPAPGKGPKGGGIRPEIKTASQLLAAMTDGEELAFNHFKSVAFRVLPAGTLGNAARKAEIWKALEDAAKQERA